MASRRTLIHRLLQIPRPFQSRCNVAAAERPPAPPSLRPERMALPSLIERLKSMGVARGGDRFRLDAVTVPPDRGTMTVEEARKVLRVSQMERVRERLRGTAGNFISYERLVEICGGGDGGKGIAKALDESGAVLVLGDVVFHRPDQVARAIASVIPLPSASITASTATARETDEDDHRHSELLSLERRKAAIDVKAEAGVRRELWCGLAFLVAQTAGFMRLTFWELSWDVMEPICFYMGSIYFMAGYAFFLRTAKDPSFEGFFNSRLAVHQRRLMAAEGFNLRRLHELRHALGHASPRTRGMACCLESVSCPLSSGFHSQYGGCNRRDGLLGVLH